MPRLASLAVGLIAVTATCVSACVYDSAGVEAADAPAPPPSRVDAATPPPLVDAAVPPLPCPADYVTDAEGRSYRFVATGRAWLEAEADCEDDGAGTHLVVIDDADENQAVDAIATGMETWIGLSDQIIEGKFRWVTGGDPADTFTNWAMGQPNNDDLGQDCAELRATGTWNDNSCTIVREYVCECDGRSVDE